MKPDRAKLDKRRAKRALTKFPNGQRVMGDPGRYGKVVGHEDGGVVVVWWDVGVKEPVPEHRLSRVADRRV